MARVLVTGAAGYLGGHCLHAFLAAGHEAWGIDLRLPQVNLGPHRLGDLCDLEFLRRCLGELTPDLIVHCAGRMDDAAPALLHKANIVATLALMEAMREAGPRALVLSSTCEIYAPGAPSPLREDAPLAPQTAFGWSRMVVEEIVRECAGHFGLRCTILRAFHLVGAEEALRAIAPPLHRSAPLGALLAALGPKAKAHVIAGVDHDTRDGSPEHDLLYVHDAARAHVRAGERLLSGGDAAVCNLSRGRGVTEKELAILLRRVSGAGPVLVEGAARPGASGRAFADPHRARKLLHWQAETGLEQAVASGFAHWQAHQAHGREGELR